jgi:Ser/Thr protein kinase RdoA (MazF antagonist)
MIVSPSPDHLRRVLARWRLADAEVTELRAGLINLTLRVQAPREFYILQRLNPIFRPEIHHDIDAVTGHLARRGLRTPRLVPATDGRLWVEDGGVWRLQTGLRGETVHRVGSPGRAREAGRLLGRFHQALSDCEHCFRFTRQAHDLDRHLAGLRCALQTHRRHPLREAVAPLRDELLALAATLPPAGELPRRVVHGDPKISNILFAGGRALAWVDLDTLGRQELPIELGDALRSWCNRAGEDGDGQRLDLDLYEAALGGYATEAGTLLTGPERAGLVWGLLGVCVELASRFAADALNESYFGWSPQSHPSRGHHNLHRARGQLRLARSVRAQQGDAERRVQRLLGQGLCS